MQLEMKYAVSARPFDTQAVKEIEAVIGYEFNDQNLLKQAFTTIERDPKNNYERLEYFGDAVLNLIIKEYLVETFKDATPHMLTKANSDLCRQEVLAALCLKLRLHDYLQHAKGIIPLSCLCDVIESMIGALYTDGGMEVVEKFVLRFFVPMVRDVKVCPTEAYSIIRQAAIEHGRDITYVWTNTTCKLLGKEGSGAVENSMVSTDKGSQRRLSRYLAEREYIKNRFPSELPKLVRLAIDPDYHPLSPASISLTKGLWVEGLKNNMRERLHTLMQKLKSNDALRYFCKEPDDEGEDSFIGTLTLNGYLEKPITVEGLTKREAYEKASQEAYLHVQTQIVFGKDIAGIASIELQLDIFNPVVSLNEFCQRHGLMVPQYTSSFKEKDGEKHMYYRVTAPWLAFDIKGSSHMVGDRAKQAAASRVIALMKYVSSDFFEPKKLDVINQCAQTLQGAPDAKSPIALLSEVCQCYDLELPSVESRLCEGLTSDGENYQTTIAITPTNWCKRQFIAYGSSKSDSYKEAAKKAVLHIANKMVREHLNN